MGKTMFQKLSELISDLKKTKSEISHEELKIEIMKKIGADKRTLQNCSRTLTELNLIREEDGGRIIFI